MSHNLTAACLPQQKRRGVRRVFQVFWFAASFQAEPRSCTNTARVGCIKKKPKNRLPFMVSEA
jgi:hypothetical protein